MTRAHAKSRAKWAVFAILSAVGFDVCSGTAAGADLASLAEGLGEASHAQVNADSIRWEPSRGMLGDLLLGRRVLFLGAPVSVSASAGGISRDVYRARVRVAPNGVPLRIAATFNLTNTPEGDDLGLSVEDSHAAFVTLAYGHVQGVTILDLESEGAQNLNEKTLDRAMAAVTNMQTTGSFAGIARQSVTFDEPVVRAGLALKTPVVTIDTEGERGVRKPFHYDVHAGTMTESSAHAEGARHLPKWAPHWAVDTLRAVPWIGNEPIAWLEEKAASLRDRTRRSLSKDEQIAAEPGPSTGPVGQLTNANAKSTRKWPPENIRSIWKTPEPQEGEWALPKHAAAETKGAPAFYTTYVRPDEERPYAKVLLVVMDMQALELGMEAGVEDPKPLTGPPGNGRLPRDPTVYKRVAAAFNGGFKTEHGHYGMVLNHRVLLPPVPGAATLVALADGRVAMGSWGAGVKVGGLKDIADDSIVSLRQNLDPLVAGDVVNPSGRNLWGYTRDGTGMQTERSGVCVTASGNLIYAWGDDLNGTTLGKALKMAGCAYAMHLDMNPHHTGLVFTNINEFKGKNYKSELLTPKMGISPDRFLEYAPKDFFYVMRRDRDVEGPTGIAWKADPGTQPDPERPSVREALEEAVLVRELKNVTYVLRAGTEEPTRAPVLRELRAEDPVLLSVPLGTQREKRPRGLSIEGKTAWMASPDRTLAALTVDAKGTVGIVDAAPDGASFVQLPRLLREGSALTVASASIALGTRADGSLVLATSERSNAVALARALSRAGVRDAVCVEGQTSVLRAGTANPPRTRNAETTLSALATEARPMGFVFEAIAPYVPPKKK
jgi:hypothetical protein